MLQTFTSRELTNAIDAKAREVEGLCNIAKGSFEKDVSCILRMYVPDSRGQVEIRCPFTDLGLIVPAIESPEKDRYRFLSGSKQNLPDLVFMATVFNYASEWYPGQNSLPLSHITFGPMSPVMAFRLSESECGQRIERVCRQINGAMFTETNGIRQVQFFQTPEELNKECLKKYYGGRDEA